METFEKIAKLIETNYRENGMKWLSGIGYTGMVAGPILAAVGAVRAYKEIERRKKERDAEMLPFKETAVIVAKNAIVPAAIVGVTIYSTVKVQKDLTDKYKSASDALTTALVLGENKVRELKEAEKEVVGEKKSEEIQKKADEKAVQNTETKGLNSGTGPDVYIGIDVLTGQSFLTTNAQIENAKIMVNRLLAEGFEVTLNDFLEKCSLEPYDLDTCELGDKYKWYPTEKNRELSIVTDYHHDKYGRPAYLILYPSGSRPEIS